jgi:hypothetical protein
MIIEWFSAAMTAEQKPYSGNRRDARAVTGEKVLPPSHAANADGE